METHEMIYPVGFELDGLAGLDADECWVSVHETVEMMPLEGLMPRQHRVRLKVNGFGFVNATTVSFDYDGPKARIAYISFRRGNRCHWGGLSKPLEIRSGDTLNFGPGALRLSAAL